MVSSTIPALEHTQLLFGTATLRMVEILVSVSDKAHPFQTRKPNIGLA